MKNINVKIFVFVIIILILGVILTVVSTSGKSSNGKYDTFATCLKDKGANFYGAFWCPHCKEQKAEFGSSAKLLPYTECSLTNGSGQTQPCIDKGIESYPTWTFADSIKITEKTAPVICTKKPGIPGEDPICDENKQAARSEYAKGWLFPDYHIYTVEEPVHTGDEWTFAGSSQVRGRIPLETLAKQTSCELPVDGAQPVK